MSAQTRHALEVIDPTRRTAKKAQFEAFEFEITDEGNVLVRNGSYADPSEHEHTVTVDGGVPTSCTCKGFLHGNTTKHLTAVAIRQPVIKAAIRANETDLRTDGGSLTQTPAETDEEECDACSALPESWPCAKCFIFGDKSLPDDA